MGERTYAIGELARLSGVSTRALRLYEDAGLLRPERAANGYRRYTARDVDRLQEVLLLRRAGVAVADIAPLLSEGAAARRRFLREHLEKLRRERDDLDRLINTVEMTIECEEKGIPMADTNKFEGMKRKLIEENERQYGAEAREKYGDATVDESNRKLMGLTEEQYARFQELGAKINAAIERAVTDGVDPLGEEGERVCALHREWLGFTWPQYAPEMHRGLAEGYVADERFRAYYDARVEGCAQWLRDAIVAHA